MTTIQTAPTARPARRGRIGRIATAAAIALGLTFGSVAVAAPAQAATSVSFCFKWSTGAAYSTQPVNLQQWNGSQWVTIRSGKTNASGCGTFSSTPSNVYLIVQARAVLNNGRTNAVWQGYTPYYANPGTGGVHVNTGYVYYQYSL